jgi:hypothetical protein
MPHVAMRICHQVRIGLKKEKKKKKGRKKQMCKLDTVYEKTNNRYNQQEARTWMC